MAHGHKSDEKIVYVGDSRVRQKSSRPDPADYTSYPGKSEAFIPNFLLKEWMVAAVVMVGILVLVMAHPSPLGYPADPTNTQFIPMPDWYFLFMYQLLKYPYTSNQFVVLGTLVLPGLMFGGLLLAPFLDTGKERRFYKRPIATSMMFLTLLATIYLTVFSWHHYQNELEAKGIIPEHIKREQLMEEAKAKGEEPPKPGKEAALPPLVEDDAAMEIYSKAQCIACHGDNLKGNTAGGVPALLGLGDKLEKDAIAGIITNGQNGMPSFKDKLSTDEINKLADWLSKQKKAE